MFERLFKNKVSRTPSMEKLVNESLERIDKIYKGKGEGLVKGLATGFNDLDILTSGLNKGDLVIVGGRPSMGKSAFVLSIIRQLVVDEKIPVLFFSLAESKEELVQKLLCLQAKVDIHKTRTGYLSEADWAHLTAVAGEISNIPLFIDDTPMIKINELYARVHRIKKEKGIKLMIIDYLQLMTEHDNPEKRREDLTKVSRLLKKLAEKLQLPIIVTSQLSRNTESRKGHRPFLCDLRDSGSIELYAGKIFLLFREEYYNPDENNQGQAEVIIAKNKIGPVGSVYLKFIKSQMRFDNIS